MLGPIGGMSGPAIVDRVWPTAATPEAWRILLPLPVIAAAVYFAALALAGPAFARRREKVLAIVEGKA